jgi:hypothetical protein
MDAFQRALAAERGGVGASMGPRGGFNRVGAAVAYQNRPGVGAPARQVDNIPENPVDYTDTKYSNAEQSVFGLGFGAANLVPAGNLAFQILFQPERPINPSRFVMPSTVFGGFIVQIRIGGSDVLPAQLGIPWEFFSEVSTAPDIEWWTINTTPGVTFTVANPTGAALLFTGAFYGTALRQ